jgi:hypothetical protein
MSIDNRVLNDSFTKHTFNGGYPMKKLLLILSLVASAASISAADDASTPAANPSRVETVKAKFATMYATCTKANAKALPGKAFNQATVTTPRAIGSAVVTTAVVIVVAKKAYDRYKVWKNKKAAKTADKEEVTA